MIKVEKNVPLGPMTTFKVGGPARYFVRVASIDDIKEAVNFCHDKKLPLLILGAGSNLIIGDRRFNGLVIKPDFRQIAINGAIITGGAGLPLGAVIDNSLKNSLTGLEWAAGIPGTVGGAIHGNAGAFGSETKDVIDSVKSFAPDTGKITKRSNNECRFGYRDSIFKHNSEIIIEADYRLSHGKKESIQKEIQKNISYRIEHHPINFPSCGSIFKNVAVTSSISRQVADRFRDSIKTDPFPVIPTAKIIAESGLSGKKIGGAQISPKHTNYIINTGNTTAQNIIDLIDDVRQTVWDQYKIELDIEPQLIGLQLKPLK